MGYEIEEKFIENEFLSILVLMDKKVWGLLQIKPYCLLNKKNQEIFKAILKIKEDGLIPDIPTICKYIGFTRENLDYLFQLISDDNLPIYDYTGQFINIQKLILEKYKTKLIEKLSIDLKERKIDNKEYLEKMQKINELVINDEVTILTEKELEENINSEVARIELSNFQILNDILRIVKGDFIMIGASTGVGKSGLLLNIMNNLMDNYQCIYFNMEMSKSTIYQRIIAIRGDIPVYDVSSPKSDMQREIIKKAISEIAEKKIIIENKATYMSEIKAVVNKYKDKNKHTILFIDHIGLIKSTGAKNLYEQTTEVAKELRQLCLEYDCTIISACQLNRASYNSEELNLSMLKDSGELENSSSKVILLYKNKNAVSKDKYVDNMMLDIVKNRDGRLGRVPCLYNKIKQIFIEKSNDYN